MVEQESVPGQTRCALFEQVLLVVFASFLGLVGGTLVGAMRLPPGSGLAGPAIALGYGMVGMGATGTLAVLAGMRLRAPTRRRCLWLLGATALAVVVWLFARIRQGQVPEPPAPPPPTTPTQTEPVIVMTEPEPGEIAP